MGKRFLCLILAILIAFSAIGCSKEDLGNARLFYAGQTSDADTFEDLTDEDLQAIDSRVTKELLGDISIKTCVDARVSFGGTAPSEVRRQIEVGRQWLNSLKR